VKKICLDIHLKKNFNILTLAQIGIKNNKIAVKLRFLLFISLLLFFGFILNNQVYFVSLIKKISSLEAYLKSAKGFPKSLFSLLKVGRRRHRRLKKAKNFCIKIFNDEF